MSGLSFEIGIVLAAAIMGVLALPWRTGSVSASWSAVHRATRGLWALIGGWASAASADPAVPPVLGELHRLPDPAPRWTAHAGRRATTAAMAAFTPVRPKRRAELGAKADPTVRPGASRAEPVVPISAARA